MKKHLKKLNKKQIEAVNHYKGPCMVLAGPGTGKTTIIINRITNLIKKYSVNPKNILVVTFTKAASMEMEKRLFAIQKVKKNYKEVTFGTFHSIFFRILKEYKGYKLEGLIKEQERNRIIKSIIVGQGYGFFEDEQTVEGIIRELSYINNILIDINNYAPTSCKKAMFKDIHREYRKYKKRKNVFDYDDMITHCYELLMNDDIVLKKLRDRYNYILIDEFQDINIAQFKTIRLIAYPENNLFAVGDDDQSIYKFRGADPSIMTDFETLISSDPQKDISNFSSLSSPLGKKAKLVNLEENYRNNKLILNSAISVIENNSIRYEKNLKPIREIGELPRIVRVEDFELEAKVIGEKIKEYRKKRDKYSGIAIIYRTNIQSRAIIEELTRNNIPFLCRDGIHSVYNHWVFEDVISYLKASQNIEKDNSVYRIINKPYRFISREEVYGAMNKGDNLIENLLRSEKLNSSQLRHIKKLNKDIKKISKMKPYDATNYITDYIGYEGYLRDYGLSRHIDYRPLMDLVNEIKSSTKAFSSIKGYIENTRYILDNMLHMVKKPGNTDRVEIMTMHKAKGLEFDIVFIAGVVEGLIPCFHEEIKDGLLEEERRLFYMAMTRAKNNLYLLTPKHRYGKKVEVSRFTEEMFLWLRAKQNKDSLARKL